MKKLTRILVAGSALPLGLVAWSAAPAPAALVEAALDTVEVTLESVDGSAAAGTVRFADVEEGAAEVMIEVQSSAVDTELEAILVEGTCEAPGAVRTPLAMVQVDAQGAGTGSASLAQPLAEVFATPTAVLVHPAGAAGEALLCGNVTAAPASPAVPDAG